MTKSELQRLLDAEVEELSRRSYARLVDDLPDVFAYQRGGGASYHQFEVQMIEHEPGYVHILVSVDDGSFWRSCAPMTRSFIVHRDGRIEV
jgi:hypothetical protein